MSVSRSSIYEDEFVARNFDVFIAASVGDTDILKSLIIEQIDLNGRNKGGWTPLMYAAYVGHEKACRVLIENRANLDMENLNGQTALMLAASCGHENVCSLLLQNGANMKGADVDYRNSHGENCVALAVRHNHLQISRLFDEHKTTAAHKILRRRTLEKTVSNPVQTNCTTNGKECTILQQDLPALRSKSRTYSTKVMKSTQHLEQPNVHKTRFVCAPSSENRPNLPASQPEKIVNGVEHVGITPSTSHDRKLSSVPSSLVELLDQLQLVKYLPHFEQQEIDLALFLQMTDTDLKEIGIKLFGPRKKMTNAIARWHRHMPDVEPLERAYANYHRAISEEFSRKNVELNNDLTSMQELVEKYKQDMQRIENKMLNACASGRLCNSYVKECKKQAQLLLGDLKKNNVDPRSLEQSLCRICALCDQISLKLAEGNII